MNSKRGFTLIEVSLFLAITGLIFLGVTVGVSNSIAQQRNNDAVQSFAEFLRKVYSDVTNVQNNIGGGKTEKAIYGKLAVFRDGGRKIELYNVIGNIGSVSHNDTLESLKSLKVNIFDCDSSGCSKMAGIVEMFTSKWSSRIEQVALDKPYAGALLIVRNPKSGSVFTYVSDDVNIEIGADGVGAQDFLTKEIEKFKIKEANFCINPNGEGSYSRRFNVRLVKNARNSSGIEIFSPESEDNQCEK